MQIIAKCPDCGRSWQLDSSAADRRIRCRECGRLYKVPRSEELPKATEVIENTKGTIYVDEDGRTYG
jgi:DNA-directed RNA polymerase subunit RPC12/RpoP